MKQLSRLLLIFCVILLTGCGRQQPVQIAATTLPVYEFTAALCEGTGLTVGRLINDSVSCLHDYSLSVDQMRAAQQAQVIVISGAGLEKFMEDVLEGKEHIIDSAAGLELLPGEEEFDPHIWLSPTNAKVMAQNIYCGLCREFPEKQDAFAQNWPLLEQRLTALEQYGNAQLSCLSGRSMITFHDGFSYFAKEFSLEILAAMEEESGSEAPASQLKELTNLVREYRPAVFVETNGSDSAARVLARETGCEIYTLDMAMAADSYFAAMEHNIDTVKEALQ